MTDILISADKIGFAVPVFKPHEEKISANPLKLMTNFYSNRSKREIRHLISDISFELKPSEGLGIIGRNGAGKTTLLRTICGVYKHNSGQMTINGQAQGLFDFKMGMRADATGTENIYLRGIQMGLPIKKIKELLPEVVEFAGIGTAIFDVFSTYSTGMKLRLAAAISTMISPEILVLDEWVGSGDADFNKKLNKRMDAIIEDSHGLILASHTESLVRSLCSNVLVLHQGRCKFYGPTNEGYEYYRENYTDL